MSSLLSNPCIFDDLLPLSTMRNFSCSWFQYSWSFYLCKVIFPICKDIFYVELCCWTFFFFLDYIVMFLTLFFYFLQYEFFALLCLRLIVLIFFFMSSICCHSPKIAFLDF